VCYIVVMQLPSWGASVAAFEAMDHTQVRPCSAPRVVRV